MRGPLLLSLLALCTASGGCMLLALGGGAAGAAYVMGNQNRSYSQPIDAVWYATIAALDDLQLHQGYQHRDQLKGRIERHTASGDKVKITLTSRGAATDMNLRVNTFGDKSISLAIVQRIEQYLPREPIYPAAAAAPAAPVPLHVPAR